MTHFRISNIISVPPSKKAKNTLALFFNLLVAMPIRTQIVISPVITGNINKADCKIPNVFTRHWCHYIFPHTTFSETLNTTGRPHFLRFYKNYCKYFYIHRCGMIVSGTTTR